MGPYTMRQRLIPWALASMVSWWPAVAAAGEAAPAYPPCARTSTESEVSAAKSAFQTGTASFEEADYPRAITYWEDAYRRDCTAHLLLWNLARAYELNGQKERAIVALETYLERSPDAKAQQGQIEKRIDNLRKQVQAEEPEPEPTPVAPLVSASESEPVPAEAPADTTLPADTAGSSRRPIWPLFVAGGGGLILIGGGIVYILARNDLSSYEEQCENRVCPDARIRDAAEDARNFANVSGAVTIAGGVIGVTGLALYFLLPKQTTSTASAPTRVVPAVTPGYAGMSLSGSF